MLDYSNNLTFDEIVIRDSGGEDCADLTNFIKPQKRQAEVKAILHKKVVKPKSNFFVHVINETSPSGTPKRKQALPEDTKQSTRRLSSHESHTGLQQNLISRWQNSQSGRKPQSNVRVRPKQFQMNVMQGKRKITNSSSTLLIALQKFHTNDN